MNFHEVILLLVAAGFLGGLLTFREGRSLRHLFLILAIVPALFLSVEGVTEVVTCDEAYMISELSDLEKLTSRQWNLNNYHTSIAVTGNIVKALRAVRPLTELQAVVLAKSVHWFLGVACLVGIFWTIRRRWIPKDLFTEYFLIYFYSALLLPTNILAMKVANYDLWAMLLGIWGVICSLLGCEKIERLMLPPIKVGQNYGRSWRSILSETLWPDGGYTFFGIILTTLAAQEKPIAAPFLTLAITLSILMRFGRRGRIDWWLPIQIGICVGLVLCVLLATHGAVAVWRPSDLPPFDLAMAVRGLAPHFEIVLRAIGVKEPSSLTLAGLCLTAAALAGTALGLLTPARNRLAEGMRLFFPLLLIAVLILGAVSFYKIQSYLHPIYPIPEGYFVPQDAMSGETVHYLSRTRLQHIINKTANAYSIFATSLPSIFAVMAMATFGLWIWKKRSAPDQPLFGLLALGLISLAMPLVHVLTNTPIGTRYFNVWVFIVILLLGIVGCHSLAWSPRPRYRMLMVTVFCLALITEIPPFRPVTGAFWPWWANASKLSTAGVPQPGKPMPVWEGWGEEAMIAGRHLREMGRDGELPSKSFRLFTAYLGDWLGPEPAIETRWIEMPDVELSFTENDYYIVNRAAVVQGRVRFPEDAQPVWTRVCRGVSLAWVFRGSDIKEIEKLRPNLPANR